MGYNDTTYLTDFARYDPATDQWRVIASIGGIPRYAAFAFSVNNYGYVGTGSYGGIISVISTPDFWRLEDCDGSGVGMQELVHAGNNVQMSVQSDVAKNLLLRYNLAEERQLGFSVYDEEGRTVVDAELLSNTNSMTLRTSLSAGMYFWAVHNARGTFASGKVLMP